MYNKESKSLYGQKEYCIVLIKKVLYSTNKKENIIFIKKLNLLLYIIYNNNLHKYIHKESSIQYVWFPLYSYPLLSVTNIFYTLILNAINLLTACIICTLFHTSFVFKADSSSFVTCVFILLKKPIYNW